MDFTLAVCVFCVFCVFCAFCGGLSAVGAIWLADPLFGIFGLIDDGVADLLTSALDGGVGCRCPALMTRNSFGSWSRAPAMLSWSSFFPLASMNLHLYLSLSPS